MRSSDIVVVGSGHNGLVAAAYLAASGKRVLVLERNGWFGGGVVTRELTLPGFRHDQHSMAHIFIHANPLLAADELGLKSRYGLEYVFPDPPMMSVFEDGSTLALYRDRERSCTEIAKFSQQDAEAYRRLSTRAAAWLPMIAPTLYAPPAPQGASLALLDRSREGREFWRVVQMSTHDVVCEYFEQDKVRMHFARIAGENLVSPDEKVLAEGPTLRTTILGPLAEMVPDPVEEYEMVPVGPALFAVKPPEAETWAPVTFYELPTGERYVHFGVRATPRVD
jgi:phytoene dehydrogenase-like protein